MIAAAAVACALAVLTRWAYAPVIPVFVLGVLASWRAARVPLRQRLWATALAAAGAALVMGAQFGAELGRGSLSHGGEFDMVIWSWSPLNAFRSAIVNADGVLRYERPVGVFYARPVFHPSYIFPVFTPFLVLGAVQLARGRRAWAILVLGWALTVYVFLAGLAWEKPGCTSPMPHSK